MPPIPPPVVARSQPFAILTPNAPPREDTSRRRLPFDEPPQPSTNSSQPRNPRIHLGGGLFSQGLRPRRGQAPRDNDPSHAPDEPQRVGRVVATFLNEQRHPFRNVFEAGIRFLNGWDILPAIPSEGEHRRRRGTRIFGIDPNGILQHRNDAIGLGPDYTKDMTHPGTPPPGWSFNFGTESAENVDIDVPEKNSATEYLACAMCLDPLYANVEEQGSLTDEEKKRKRVWALRCGHMFDGKCVEGFMVPSWQKAKPKTPEMDSIVVPDEEDDGVTGKGKEKEKEKDVVFLELLSDNNGDSVKSGLTPLDNSTPVSLPEPAIEVLDTVSTHADSSHAVTGSTGPPVNRYNFRTRRPPPQETSSNTTRSNRRGRHGTGVTERIDSSSPRQIRGTKRKRDEKVVKNAAPKIEIRYNWNCPVVGCGKLHSSYKLQCVWKPDEENGPIAVYI